MTWLRLRAAVVFLYAQALFATVACADDAGARLHPGAGRFDFPIETAAGARTLDVLYHRPAAAGPHAPLVFVIHGDGRDAQRYRRHWTDEAERRGFVLIVPGFSRDDFPGGTLFHLGGVVYRGAPVSEPLWTFTAIERLFDALRASNAFTRGDYDLYGHSAGAQFVHRFVMFRPDGRFRVAVAANAGWYTMPDAGVPFPYGLGGAAGARADPTAAFGRRLVVLLGDADTDPHHHQLRRTPEAMAQGVHRYARGQAFFERARVEATKRGVRFAWMLDTAPGVAHSNAQMAAHAARFVGAPD